MNVPTTIVWQDPPDRPASRRGAWAPIAATLRANPGRWAVVATYPAVHRNAAYRWVAHVRRGALADLRGGFEAAGRTEGDIVNVYLRYVGPTDTATPAVAPGHDTGQFVATNLQGAFFGTLSDTAGSQR